MMRCLLRCFAGLFVVTVLNGTAWAADNKVDFTRDIRPILSDNCFACHGPDEDKRQTELRLDTRAGAFSKLEEAFVLVAGSPDRSELFKRLISNDPDAKMPPADSGKMLTKEQLELIRRWIAEGAVWSEHWAFVAPVRPELPSVKNRKWVSNPVDAFVLKRLEGEKLTPAPRADKVRLLRRLSLDLTGLPPTIEQTDAFLSDNSPQAYAKLVKQLLDSPHYGERWGRHWLDAARYADSDGYEKDKPRFVYFYRDWVVNALNRDLPYDQFIIEQLAGDQLPNPTQDQLVATGFLRNSMINEEGGIDPEQFRMTAMFDRMDAIGKSILGLTIQCSQCHTHKYDPFTQKEYYRLFAYLNNAHEASISVYTPDELETRKEIFRKIHKIEKKLKTKNPDWEQRMAAWETSVKDNQPEWVSLMPFSDDLTTGGQKYVPQADGSLLASGYAPTRHVANFRIKTELKNITAIQLELFNDPNLPRNGPGRSILGTGALSEFTLDAAPVDNLGKSEKVKIVKGTADINIPERELKTIYDDKTKKKRVTGPIAYAIDGKDETAWGLDIDPGRRNQPRKAVFTFEKPVSHAEGTQLTIHLSQRHGGWNSDDNQNNNLGRFRLSATTAADAVADPLPKRVREILSIPRSKRSDDQRAAVFSYWRTTVPEWTKFNAKIEDLWKTHPEGASQLVLREREQPRDTYFLERGDFLKPGEKMASGVPEFLNPPPADTSQSRLTFARWIADRKSPTTARTIVNRIWQTYFGTGLVATSEDLGMQGEAPSHPELLDWLSVELMENNWSLKKLHTLIVTSATYQQSAKVSPELYARDPYNRLLARGARFRVEGEIVRDIALAASGLLNPTVGGPPAFPPAPAFLFQPPASYGPKVWKESTGADRYRRSLYTFRFRSVPYPALQTFDTPNGDASCIRRSRSNTPMQALTSLNEPLFVEFAQALARKTLEDGGQSDEERLTYAFRRCLTRKPNATEAKVLLDLLHTQAERFEKGDLDPKELAFGDAEKTAELPEGTTPVQLAAWTAVARVLLNLDETITKE